MNLFNLFCATIGVTISPDFVFEDFTQLKVVKRKAKGSEITSLYLVGGKHVATETHYGVQFTYFGKILFGAVVGEVVQKKVAEITPIEAVNDRKS